MTDVEARQAEAMDLINTHFHIEDLPATDDRPDRPALVCNHCSREVTHVTRHLAERHDMDIEVWRLPQHADRLELW